MREDENPFLPEVQAEHSLEWRNAQRRKRLQSLASKMRRLGPRCEDAELVARRAFRKWDKLRKELDAMDSLSRKLERELEAADQEAEGRKAAADLA